MKRAALCLSPRQLNLVYRALRREDGSSLCPDWSREDQKSLTAALDLLRTDLVYHGASLHEGGVE